VSDYTETAKSYQTIETAGREKDKGEEADFRKKGKQALQDLIFKLTICFLAF